jgi:hypothetical protein
MSARYETDSRTGPQEERQNDRQLKRVENSIAMSKEAARSRQCFWYFIHIYIWHASAPTGTKSRLLEDPPLGALALLGIFTNAFPV